MALVAPSILAADFNNLLEEVKSVANAEFLHIDVMDGHFVPNISLGPDIYRNLKNKVDMIFDVHLMIEEPYRYAKRFVDAGADIITFHVEAVEDVGAMIHHIHQLGAKAGISLRPKTDITILEPYLKAIDLVLVMSVEPGFGGQTFMPNAIDKIKYLKRQKESNNYHYWIEVDGGIHMETAKLAVAAGCDILVAGTFIFQQSNRKIIIEEMKKL